MISYDYTRRSGVHPIEWEDFGRLCDRLAEEIHARGADMVVGIARAGLLPAAGVAARLRLDLTPVRLTRRERDRVVRTQPIWKVDVSPDVEGHVVVVVDEMADTGTTLARVRERVEEFGADRVVTASLAAHSWATPFPDAVALVTDALVTFPWNRTVFERGEWTTHPELEAALRLQEGPFSDQGEPEPLS